MFVGACVVFSTGQAPESSDVTPRSPSPGPLHRTLTTRFRPCWVSGCSPSPRQGPDSFGLVDVGDVYEVNSSILPFKFNDFIGILLNQHV